MNRGSVTDDNPTPSRRRREPSGHMVGGLYWLLAGLFLVSLSVALVWPHNELVDRFVPNFTSEVLGIFITLAVVQRLLQRQERARRMRASIGAFRRGGRALARLLGAWADILKGCHADEDPPRQVERLFAPHITEQLAQLDLNRRRGEEPHQRWVDWLLAEIDAALVEINRVVVAYGGALDPAYTEAVDELIDDPFLQLVRDLVAADADPNLWRTRMHMNRGHREDYFRHLASTAELHNRLAAEAATVRSRERAPRTGALGMELPRDYDLKVVLQLDRDWRAASPTPSSLRVTRPPATPAATAEGPRS
ncbi:hypothetical protein BH23GEM9_BH23GEM9_33480 [soil metagenome]